MTFETVIPLTRTAPMHCLPRLTKKVTRSRTDLNAIFVSATPDTLGRNSWSISAVSTSCHTRELQVASYTPRHGKSCAPRPKSNTKRGHRRRSQKLMQRGALTPSWSKRRNTYGARCYVGFVAMQTAHLAARWNVSCDHRWKPRSSPPTPRINLPEKFHSHYPM